MQSHAPSSVASSDERRWLLPLVAIILVAVVFVVVTAAWAALANTSGYGWMMGGEWRLGMDVGSGRVDDGDTLDSPRLADRFAPPALLPATPDRLDGLPSRSPTRSPDALRSRGNHVGTVPSGSQRPASDSLKPGFIQSVRR